jgi:mono/diheme cytochrome c family protein
LKFVGLVIPSAVLLTAAALASDEQTGVAVSDEQTESAAPTGDRLYEVEDGNKVDATTLMGWKTWRALACERCHGPAQEGLVGPSLIESLKRLSKTEFHDKVMNGSPEKGMPPFSASPMVSKNWEGLYAYLKGRSDGEIQPGRLTAIEQD